MLTPLFGAEDATIPVTRAAAEAAACDMQMEREALPTLLDWEKIAANADELVVYTIALEAIVVMQALQYRDYRLYATAAARDGEGAGRRLLESKEWNEVTLYALLLSYTLLDKYLIEGRELAREVHEGLRTRRIPGWQEYWPGPFHVDRVRAVVVDTCWPTVGYTSQRGTTHMQDYTTRLVLAVSHLTKEKEPHVSPPLHPVVGY